MHGVQQLHQRPVPLDPFGVRQLSLPLSQHVRAPPQPARAAHLPGGIESGRVVLRLRRLIPRQRPLQLCSTGVQVRPQRLQLRQQTLNRRLGAAVGQRRLCRPCDLILVLLLPKSGLLVVLRMCIRFRLAQKQSPQNAGDPIALKLVSC